MLIDQALAIALKHHQAGQLQQAEAIYRQILSQNPNHAGALHGLGVIANQVGQHDTAIDLIGRAIALEPRMADAHNNLGLALKAKGRLDEAVASYQRALALKPDFPEAHYNLGIVLREKGQFDEAMASYQRALVLKPDDAEAHHNLGNVLRRKGRFDEAIACFRRTLVLKPDLPEAHYNLGICLLTLGDFEAGWREHEWLWQTNEFRPLRRQFTAPRWDGSELSGRRILLHAEQGFGTTLQFLRYVKLVAERGGRIILECPSELFHLLHNLPHVEQLLSRGQTLPDFDVHCPLLSLPLILRTTLETIPACTPYLCAEPSLAGAWRSRLSAAEGRLKVGLVWAGRNTPDPRRSMPLEALAPLGQVPGMFFCSLQKGDAGQETQAPPASLEMTNWTADLHDFADTAALMANLDLIITIDTAVAHLAGAMGKPVWVLLHSDPDWRWMLQRTDSPWYPTIRLFRQTTPGDWPTVVETVVTALNAQMMKR